MKNERRLLYRRLGLIAAAALLLGLGTPLLLHPLNPPTDPATELASFERPTIPEEKNAARWLQAGAGAIVWSKEEQKTIGDASLLSYREWSPERVATVRTVLDNHRDALKIMAKARNLNDSRYGLEYSRSLKWQWTSSLQFIRAARLLAAQARMGFGTCDLKSAYGALATLGKMASTLEDESGDIALLVGVAIDRIWLSVASEAVRVDTECPPQLDRIVELMPKTDLTESLRRVFIVWTANFRLLRKENPDDAPLTDRDILRVRKFWLQRIAEPYALAKKSIDEARHQHLVDPDTAFIGSSTADAESIPRTKSVQALRQEVRALIALRRFGAEQGSFPGVRPDIPELQLPDPFTGKPLLYTRNADGSVTLKIDADEELFTHWGVSSAFATMEAITLSAP